MLGEPDLCWPVWGGCGVAERRLDSVERVGRHHPCRAACPPPLPRLRPLPLFSAPSLSLPPPFCREQTQGQRSACTSFASCQGSVNVAGGGEQDEFGEGEGGGRRVVDVHLYLHTHSAGGLCKERRKKRQEYRGLRVTLPSRSPCDLLDLLFFIGFAVRRARWPTRST